MEGGSSGHYFVIGKELAALGLEKCGVGAPYRKVLCYKTFGLVDQDA